MKSSAVISSLTFIQVEQLGEHVSVMGLVTLVVFASGQPFASTCVS